ncbi:unnamed protein product, partial [marine sediment metagenome]
DEVLQIEGEHYDSFTGVEFVEIRISSGPYYWTGSSWTATNVWASNKATLYVSSWTYTTVPPWTDGADYIVNCRAMDKANNLEPEISTITCFLYIYIINCFTLYYIPLVILKCGCGVTYGIIPILRFPCILP